MSRKNGNPPGIYKKLEGAQAQSKKKFVSRKKKKKKKETQCPIMSSPAFSRKAHLKSISSSTWQGKRMTDGISTGI